MADDDDFDVGPPTHRCPHCGGTSQFAFGRASSVTCKVCTKYGPFGLVPRVVAIEVALKEEIGAKELVMRRFDAMGASTVDWLLRDTKPECSRCGGTGISPLLASKTCAYCAWRTF